MRKENMSAIGEHGSRKTRVCGLQMRLFERSQVLCAQNDHGACDIAVDELCQTMRIVSNEVKQTQPARVRSL